VTATRPSGVAHSTVRLLVAVGVMRITWMAMIVVLVLAQKLLPAKVTIGDTPLQ
jgi:predicted metal-binding membrane protein